MLTFMNACQQQHHDEKDQPVLHMLTCKSIVGMHKTRLLQTVLLTGLELLAAAHCLPHN